MRDYTWKLVRSGNYTYFVTMVDLWALAEPSTGTFVSCLPVLPRLLRFVGPKLSSSISLSMSKQISCLIRIIMDSQISDFSPGSSNCSRITAFLRHRIISYHTPTQLGGKSNNLVQQSSQSRERGSTETTSTSSLVPALDDRQTTTQDDIDSVQQEIRVERKTHVEMSSNTTNVTSWDLEEQQIQRGW